jgi:hypothetical protein
MKRRYSPLKINRSSGGNVTVVFKVGEKAEQESSVKAVGKESSVGMKEETSVKEVASRTLQK